MSDLDFRRDVLPFFIATLGEWVALFYWLDFQLRGDLLLANVLLWAGFLVERVTVIGWLRHVRGAAGGIAAKDAGFLKTAAGVIGITLPEVAIWIGWLWLARSAGYGVAAAALAVAMLVEHSLELSLVKEVRITFFFTHAPTLFFTAMEVLGAVGWLILVDRGQTLLGGLVLLTGLGVEHVVEGITLKKPRLGEAAGAG